MKNIREEIRKKRLYFDGGFGTLLQAMGLPAGTPPEIWNLTEPDRIISVHRSYVEAGCNFLTTNTFGVNCAKYPQDYEKMIAAAVNCARVAADGKEDRYIAFDMGPTGRMLEPLGDLPFEEAVALYAANVRAAVAAGVDLILIETINDSYEAKAAVLAAKENCDLPIFLTCAYDLSGKLMTGADPLAMIAMAEGLRVDAIGMNCSFGPDKMLPLADIFVAHSSLPLIVNPNAGLPQVREGETVYDIDADAFSDYMVTLAKKGFTLLGGCCGTTPEYIAATVKKTAGLPFSTPDFKGETLISSYTHAVTVDREPILIGERINPTGKPKLKAALREGDLNYILNEGIRQTEAGTHILDVNVGLPEIDEAETMYRAVTGLQAVTDTPLQLDSSDPAALERSMRIYNGKPLINSVNGKSESMDAIFPLVRKYGGAVIALTLDGEGIPDRAEDRVRIAERIIACAAEYGIDKKDIIVDPLCLTVSSDPQSAVTTLTAVRLLHERGIRTSLGVSNISFGLPEREKINTAFFTMALEAGLNCAIMNPFSTGMTDAYYAYRVLRGLDTSCTDYIAYAAAHSQTASPAPAVSAGERESLKYAVIKGLKEPAVQAAQLLLKTEAPLDVINLHIVPALNEIGLAFEEKRAFLPQLLMSAEAASAAFEKIKEAMPAGDGEHKNRVILATVRGDIHDIGKNIVKVLLESYGFRVYDLGRDVPPEVVCESVRKTGCRLVGLSALMTTTVPAMAETIALLHETYPDVKVVVGGAVLNQEYADQIHADRYCADAMDTVHYAQEYYRQS